MMGSWRFVVSIIVIVVAVIGAAQMSMLGGLAAIVSAAIVVTVLFHWAAAAPLLLAYGILCIGGFYSQPSVDGASQRIAVLTQVVQANLFGYGFESQHQAALEGTINACVAHQGKETTKMVAAGYDVLETWHTGWASWAFKPKFNGGECFIEAEKLARISPTYKYEYDAIIADSKRWGIRVR
jgi:hypothetical protein